MILGALINLQEIDTAIMKIEASLGELPKRVDGLRLKLEGMKKEYADHKEKLDFSTREKIRLEGEIQVINQKLKKYQDQVYSVTTNKEYDAISTEIENSEKLIEETENKVFESMESEEEHTKKCEELEESTRKITEELAEVEAELELKKSVTSDEIHRLKEQRKKFVGKLSKPLYMNYERTRKKKDGIALASVQDYKCMQCFGIIPAQTVVELRKRDQIILCETCGRILYVEDNVKKAVPDNVINE